MLEYKGTTFTTSIVEDALEQDYTYEGEDFPIAISMVDQSETDFVSRTGVTFQVRLEQYNPVLPSDRPTIKQIESHPCSEEELNKFHDVPES